MAQAALKEDQQIDYELLLEKAKELFLGGVRRSNNAACGYVLTSGRIDMDFGSVCHSFLTGMRAKYLINGLQEGSNYGENPGRILPKETELWFVDYILNRSPYSETFISKDAEKALEEGLTVQSGDHPGNLVGAGAVALRRLWEHVYVAQAAYDLQKAGVHEDLAFLVGHSIQSPSHLHPGTMINWDNNLNWHTSVDIGIMTFGIVKRWMQHKVHTPNLWYSKEGAYRGYSAMYGTCYDNNLSSYIKDKFPIELCADDVGASNNNPFKASLDIVQGGNKPGVRLFPYKKGIEVMAEWAKTHLMEKINNA